MQEQAVRERLGVDRIGLLEEHHRLAEAHPRPDDFHYFVCPLLGAQGKLYLSVGDEVEPLAWIASVEQHLAARDVQRTRALGDAFDLLGRGFFEQWQVR